MLLDALAFGILAVYALIGLWRGTLASASGLVSLIVGYWAGFAASGAFGPALAARLGVSELIGAPLAGTAGFIVAWLACSMLFRFVKRRAEIRRLGNPRSASDRLGGVFFGLARGGLIVVLLGWLALWLDAAQSLNGDAGGQSSIAQSSVAGLSSAVVETALHTALDDSAGSRVVARLAARPGEALGSMRALVEDERIRAVQADSLFWRYVEHDAVENALNRKSFWNVVHDDELRARLADLGVVDERAAADPQVFRDTAEKMLRELGPQLRGLSEDPELQRLAHDPEIQQMLESGDTLALLTHPEIRKLVERVSERVSDDRGASTGPRHDAESDPLAHLTP